MKNQKQKKLFKLLPIIVVILYSFTALAGASEKKVVAEIPDPVKDESPSGWNPALKANGNFYLGQTSNVPGATDGLSFAFGYQINGAVNYLSSNKNHEWVNTLFWELGFTRTPVIDAFTKSLDKIDFATTYLYHFPKLHIMGLFGTARVTTAMLKSYEMKAGSTDVIRLGVGEEMQVDGNGNPLDENGQIIDANHPRVENYAGEKKIHLTDAFSPLLLRQGLGAFLIPIDKPEFKLDMRLGLSSWETFVQGGYTVDDNADTPDFLELRKMQDSIQIGAEFSLMAGGVFKERLLYGFNALFMQPFYDNADTKLKGIDLMNMEFELTAGVALWEFLSVNYSFKAYRQPLIVEGWQIQNSLMISLGINLPRPKPEAQEKPCNCPCADETKTNEAKTDEAETDEAETDKAKTDKAETDKAETTDTSKKESAPETPKAKSSPASKTESDTKSDTF